MGKETIELARSAYDRNDWREAYRLFHAADRHDALVARDLEQFAVAAILSGNDDEGAELRERAHALHLEDGDLPGAARAAIAIGMTHLQSGDIAQGGGWLAKAHRLVNDPPTDCVEQGYLMLPEGLQASATGDHDRALTVFTEAAEIGERFADRSLVALARHAAGREAIHLGRRQQGVALLDEAMVEVTGGRVNPIISGIVYCSVIDACRQIFDVRRGQEWTEALDRWSKDQPASTLFRGQCLVFRSEFMALAGEWERALDEAAAAAKRLSEPPPHKAAGSAHYQHAEMRRLLGDLDQAEASYARAAELGHPPHPGLALLRLAQGRVDQAVAAIRRELDEEQDRLRRCRLLGPCVEILVAAGMIEEAAAAASELSGSAQDVDTPLLSAAAGYCEGTVLLVRSDAKQALPLLRAAHATWRDLGNPYEAARTSVQIALACRALGDDDTCEVELRSARIAFERLNAALDLERVDRLSGEAKGVAGLTGREVEVLAHLAEGKTNRQIANELVISEKTVARHIANIFVKLGVSSRSAATAFAVKNRIA